MSSKSASVKNTIKSLNAFEICLLCVVIGSAIFNFISSGEYNLKHIIAASAALLGVICVVFGAKGSLANWFFGIIECFLHIYITCVDHFYGDALQRLFYNLPMQFWGLKTWRKRKHIDAEGKRKLKTRYMSNNTRAITLLVITTATIMLALFLKNYGNELRSYLIMILSALNITADFKTLKPDYPSELGLWLDSFTTVSSIVAMYISVKAYVEQWWIWLLINIAYLIMWSNNPNSDFAFMTIVKYSIYLVNTFYGIYMWHKLSKD